MVRARAEADGLARPLIRQPPAATFSRSHREGNRAAAAGKVRLYTDVGTHPAEAARRFGLVEEYWDVVVGGWSEGGFVMIRHQASALNCLTSDQAFRRMRCVELDSSRSVYRKV